MSDYKYAHWTMGDFEAVINCIGEKNALGLKSGELKFVLKDGSAEIHKAVKPLFDKTGRRIPLNLKSSVCDPESEVSFRLIHEMNYPERRDLFAKFISQTMNTASDFIKATNMLILKLEADYQLKNILKGTYLPIILPQVKRGNYLDESRRISEQAGLSFLNKYPGGHFGHPTEDYSRPDFASMRNQELAALLEECTITALFFPGALKGFSVTAQREQMKNLPKGFVLSGLLEASVAMTMYPEVFSSNNYITYLTCAGLRIDHPKAVFEISHRQRTTWINLCKDLKKAKGEISGGLLYINPDWY